MTQLDRQSPDKTDLPLTPVTVPKGMGRSRWAWLNNFLYLFPTVGLGTVALCIGLAVLNPVAMNDLADPFAGHQAQHFVFGGHKAHHVTALEHCAVPWLCRVQVLRHAAHLARVKVDPVFADCGCRCQPGQGCWRRGQDRALLP